MNSDHRSGEIEIGPERPAPTDEFCPDSEKQKVESTRPPKLCGGWRNRKGGKVPPLREPSEVPPVHTLDSLRARLIFFLRHHTNGHGHISPETSHEPNGSPSTPHPSPLLDRGGEGEIAKLDQAINNQLPTINQLGQLDWSLLLKQTKRFAHRQMKRYFWRGEEKGGVLPDGHEPKSIAAEAVAEFLNEVSTFNPQLANLNHEQVPARSAGVPPASSPGLPPSEAVVIVGGTPPKLAGETPALQVQRALRRRAHHLIDRLRHRTENRLFRNVEDLAPFMTDDDEAIAIWELVPAPDATPLEELLYKEECAEVEKLKNEFIVFLGKDRLLKGVFACQWAGEFKPKAIASALKLPVRAIQPIQRRLRRRGTEFFHLKFPGKIKVRANYLWL